MRVLYFHQHFTTPDGSGGTRSYEFARALVVRGHKVTMVCGQHELSGMKLAGDPHNPKALRGAVDGIDVIALPFRYSNRDGLGRRAFVFLKFGLKSIKIALNEKYDLLFASSTPLTAALPGVVARCMGRREPFVFEVRDLWPELPQALGMRNPFFLGAMSFLEWAAYRTAAACIGLSPGIVEGIRRRSPADRTVLMIPNGCDFDVFSPFIRAPLALGGVNPGNFVAGFTGAHGVANGLDAVLDAAAEVLRRGRFDIKFVLVGDGKCKEALVARAHREGLNNCIFLAPVKKTEIARITANFDCGLMILKNVPAFYHGTSPNKFFDYLASGIPVVTNYPGWLAEMIRDSDCGIVVPPSDPAAMADALISMADDRERAKAMGSAARKMGEKRFNRAVLAGQFVAFLEGVAKLKVDPSASSG